MSRPASPEDICNLALDVIGQQPVVSIANPSSKEEGICARWYDATRQIVLREFYWSFAKKRYTSPRNLTPPEFDYTDSYSLPADCLRLYSVGGFCEEDLYRHYDIEGRTIYINNIGGASIPIRYCADITDISIMDSLFINVFSLRLASKIAYKFSLKPTLLKQVMELLASEEGKAVSVSSQERPIIRIQRSKYIQARRGLYYGNGSPYAGPYTYFDSP